MVCSLIKKGLLGAALGAGTLFLVFGTSAPSYVKTAFHKMRQTAKDSIDPRFEIERARSDGATLLTGGTRLGGELADGWFVAPTAFGDVDHHSDLAREEVFGPVQAIIRFHTDEEVLDRANDSPFGLGAYLHTRDLGRIQRFVRELEAGTVAVNGMGRMSPATPFGGYKQSGYGREGGRAGIEEMVRSKTVFVAP